MKKLESSLRNMILSLFLICSVMSGALASVYLLTKGPIANADKKKINDAISAVVPPFDNNPAENSFKIGFAYKSGENESNDTLTCFPAYNGGKLVGTAIKTYTNKGFGGFVSVMVGIKPDGTIFNTRVMEQKETPGLGSKMTEPKFHDQFNGANINKLKLSVKKDGGDVDAITAATISSRAYCDALKRASEAFKAQSTESAKDSSNTILPKTGGGQ